MLPVAFNALVHAPAAFLETIVICAWQVTTMGQVVIETNPLVLGVRGIVLPASWVGSCIHLLDVAVASQPPWHGALHSYACHLRPELADCGQTLRILNWVGVGRRKNITSAAV